MKVKNKIMDNDLAALYMGIYGVLIQIIAFAVIYTFSNFIISDSVESTTKTLVYLWYLLPIFALIPLTLAILQIRQRKAEGKSFKKLMAGLLVNTVWILAMMVFLGTGFGITQDNNDEIQLDGMKASEIVSVLSNQGYPVAGGNDYDEPGDRSQYPWNIPGCTSAAEFWIPDGTEDGQSVGYVEVYNSIEACKERRDQAAVISSFYPAEPYYVQVGKVFLQVPKALPEKSAAEYKTALLAMAEGDMPKPPAEGVVYYTGQWTGYIGTLPEYDYTGTKDVSFADRHFELKDLPQNTPEYMVAMHFYYDIAGEYDKLYDLYGSESLRISATNTEANFREGVYKQEYIVRQLSTLSAYEFVNMDSSILELIKNDIETNNLTEYTYVSADFKMTNPAGQQGQAELSDGDYTFYFLCGKNQTDNDWKIYQLYWD